jgi:PAS domain S-box-containing protein
MTNTQIPDLDKVLQRVCDGIVAVDRDWCYTYVNPLASQMMQHSSDDLIGHCAWTLFPAIVGSDVYQAMHRSLESYEFLAVEQYYVPWQRWYEIRIYPDQTGLTAYFTDTTERKHLENSLRESEERRKLALEGSRDAIWDWDVLTNQVVLSPQWRVMRGFSAEESFCSASVWADGIHPEDIDRVMALVQAHFAGETEFFSAEYRVCKADGSYLWILDRGKALRNADGIVVRMAGSETDITPMKAVEAQFTTLNTELELRVQERTAALEASNRELEAFSYSVSHDLRAPLRGIRWASEQLRSALTLALPPAAEKCLTLLQDQAQVMGQLIDALLEFSNLGHCQLHRQWVDPNPLIQQVLEGFQVDLASHPTVIDIQPLERCQADPILLQQIWTNLISNAIKYTKYQPQPRISIGMMEIQGQPAYFIQDNGVGFDLEQADRIYDVFQRLHPSSEFDGIGVGLALTRRIIERHGGTICAQAEVNVGATFHFTLPSTNPH